MVYISHVYLLPFLHLCHLSFLSPPSLLPKMQSFSGSFTQNTFYTSYLFIYTFSTILFLSQLFSLSNLLPLLLFYPPSLPFSLSPSLHLSPTATASLSLGWGKQYHPTWGPVKSQLKKQGAPENTHNSMFQTGLQDKGKPHTWLTMWVSLGSFVEEEASDWHQKPLLRVCIYVCENECVMSP